MEFIIQDPTYENTKPLRESLLNGLRDMSQGGGVYAFATSEGARFLLGDQRFKEFIANGCYYLIVGTDDITDVAAIRTLKAFEEEYAGHLTVKVYIHDGIGSILHPKYSWFKGVKGDRTKGLLIIGSGNLTRRGMKNNREAYAAIHCSEKDIGEVESEWQRWVNHSQRYLYDPEPAMEILAKRNRTLLGRLASAIKRALGIG